jgi:RNA polymerase sigma-70 factor (ECF subfamily)
MKDEEAIVKLLEENKLEAAFNKIVEVFSAPLYQHIRTLVKGHDDTDDVLQNTFVKIWKGLPNFRRDAAIFTWTYRIATNESLSFLKRTKKLDSLVLTNSEPTAFHTESFSPEEIQELFEKAVNSLPPKQALVFKMRYFDQIPYETLSEILDTSVGALKASYFHAVKKIEAWFHNKLNL